MAQAATLPASICLAALAVAVPMAQAPASAPAERGRPAFRVSVNLVQVDVVVTDSKGRRVAGLGPQDFEVLDDGKPQSILGARYVPQTAPLAAGLPVRRRRRPSADSAAGLAILPGSDRLTPGDVRRTIVFLVDDESLAPEVAPLVRRGIETVVENDLRPGDLAAVIRTSGGEGALEQFTSDRRILLAAAARIRWLPGGRGLLLFRRGSLPMDRRDARFLEADSYARSWTGIGRVMAAIERLPGKKAVILISQGWITADRTWVTDPKWDLPVATDTGRLVDWAIRAGATIYPVDPTPLDSMNPGADYDVTQDYQNQFGIQYWINPGIAAQLPQQYQQVGLAELEMFHEGMRALAEGTGGFLTADTNDIAFGMSRALGDLGGYYVVEFKPGAPEHFFAPAKDAPPPFHRLKIRVRRRRVRVRYADGYLGRNEQPGFLTGGGVGLAQALESPFSSSALPLRLTAIFNERRAGAPEIDLLVHVGARDISFTSGAGGRWRAALEVATRITDEKGARAGQPDRTIPLEFSDPDFRRVTQRGLLYEASVAAPHSGYYEAQVAVKDKGSGRVGSARGWVYVPDVKSGRLAMSGLLAYGPAEAPRSEEAPAVAAYRVFENSSTLDYACRIFNAPQAEAGTAPLEARAVVLKEGKAVFAPPQPALQAGAGGSPGTLVSGSVPLSSLPPGSYILEVAAWDRAGKRAVAQWTDFDIAGPAR